MNEVSETCSLCNKPNDQMLMLSCVHDPCINCAASAYAEQIHIKGQSKELYICEICGEETLLDSSTIAELLALANTVIKLPSKNTTPAKANTTSAPTRKKQTQQPPNPSNNPTSIAPSKRVIYYCKDHSEQEISYYCFTCWTNICPECAIHGAHKDHEVKLIKKAIAQVKGEYLQVIGKVNDSQGAMGKLKQGYLRLIKQSNDRHARERNTITREFDIIRSTLASKEKELIKELDDINKQNLSALTNILETINANTQEAVKLKRTIEVITKKDDVLILEDYRKMHELEESLANVNKSNDSISGQSYHLNVEFLQQECKELVENIAKTKLNQKKQEIGSGNYASGTSKGGVGNQ